MPATRPHTSAGDSVSLVELRKDLQYMQQILGSGLSDLKNAIEGYQADFRAHVEEAAHNREVTGERIGGLERRVDKVEYDQQILSKILERLDKHDLRLDEIDKRLTATDQDHQFVHDLRDSLWKWGLGTIVALVTAVAILLKLVGAW